MQCVQGWKKCLFPGNQAAKFSTIYVVLCGKGQNLPPYSKISLQIPKFLGKGKKLPKLPLSPHECHLLVPLDTKWVLCHKFGYRKWLEQGWIQEFSKGGAKILFRRKGAVPGRPYIVRHPVSVKIRRAHPCLWKNKRGVRRGCPTLNPSLWRCYSFLMFSEQFLLYHQKEVNC